jgi:pterin-4a-carbinolamine dehydratase
MVKKLSKTEIEASLASLPGWDCDGEKLYREFTFADF